jgi:ArsR family transcriptional regulator
MTSPDTLFSAMSDATRLRALMLIQAETELCVCELTHALGESQPKVSRHLAYMRDAGIVSARRRGTWMHYRVSAHAPAWVQKILRCTYQQLCKAAPYKDDLRRLARMADRPEKTCA